MKKRTGRMGPLRSFKRKQRRAADISQEAQNFHAKTQRVNYKGAKNTEFREAQLVDSVRYNPSNPSSVALRYTLARDVKQVIRWAEIEPHRHSRNIGRHIVRTACVQLVVCIRYDPLNTSSVALRIYLNKKHKTFTQRRKGLTTKAQRIQNFAKHQLIIHNS